MLFFCFLSLFCTRPCCVERAVTGTDVWSEGFSVWAASMQALTSCTWSKTVFYLGSPSRSFRAALPELGSLSSRTGRITQTPSLANSEGPAALPAAAARSWWQAALALPPALPSGDRSGCIGIAQRLWFLQPAPGFHAGSLPLKQLVKPNTRSSGAVVCYLRVKEYRAFTCSAGGASYATRYCRWPQTAMLCLNFLALLEDKCPW